MRSVSGFLALMLALAFPGWGLAAPDLRLISVPEAEVRCGPTEKYYVTSKLPAGTPVEVISEENGWLKILPPQGSFSWIHTKWLDTILPNAPNMVVVAEDMVVPVFAGSRVLTSRPTVISARVKRGMQVVSIGPVRSDEEGSWMPIQPTSSEYRYIRAELVGSRQPPGVTPPGTTLAARDRSTFAPAVLPTSRAQSAGDQPTPEVLWRQATDAERSGRVNEAIELYAQLAHDTAVTNRERSAEALQRAWHLQNGARNPGALSRAPVQPGAVAPPTQVRAYPSDPIPPARSPVTATVVSTAPSRADAALSVPRGQPGQSWRTYSGRLRKAGRVVDDRPTYVLEVQNCPYLYTTPQPGLNLEQYVNRNIELTGWANYRGDLRANYMTAVQVQLLP